VVHSWPVCRPRPLLPLRSHRLASPAIPHFQLITIDDDVLGARELGRPDWPPVRRSTPARTSRTCASSASSTSRATTRRCTSPCSSLSRRSRVAAGGDEGGDLACEAELLAIVNRLFAAAIGRRVVWSRVGVP